MNNSWQLSAEDTMKTAIAHFTAANGAVLCRDLIGLDLTSDEEVLEFYAQAMQEEKCNRIVVKNAVTAILELLNE